MANKNLFKSLIGKLMSATDALNEERGPAYALLPKHQLAQYAATGCLNTTFYASADEQLAKVLEPLRGHRCGVHCQDCGVLPRARFKLWAVARSWGRRFPLSIWELTPIDGIE